MINEFFPDEQLFLVIAKDLWYADYVNCLVSKVLPPKLSYQQKKKFLHNIKYFVWDESFLFKKINFDMQTAGEKRLLQLIELDEFHLNSYENARIYKEKTKKWHDMKILDHKFEVGQVVLLYNSRLKLFPGKLKSRWLGPFIITQVFPYGAIEVEEPNSHRLFKVNGQRLKHYWGALLIAKRHQLL